MPEEFFCRHQVLLTDLHALMRYATEHPWNIRLQLTFPRFLLCRSCSYDRARPRSEATMTSARSSGAVAAPQEAAPQPEVQLLQQSTAAAAWPPRLHVVLSLRPDA